MGAAPGKPTVKLAGRRNLQDLQENPFTRAISNRTYDQLKQQSQGRGYTGRTNLLEPPSSTNNRGAF